MEPRLFYQKTSLSNSRPSIYSYEFFVESYLKANKKIEDYRRLAIVIGNKIFNTFKSEFGFNNKALLVGPNSDGEFFEDNINLCLSLNEELPVWQFSLAFNIDSDDTFLKTVFGLTITVGENLESGEYYISTPKFKSYTKISSKLVKSIMEKKDYEFNRKDNDMIFEFCKSIFNMIIEHYNSKASSILVKFGYCE